MSDELPAQSFAAQRESVERGPLDGITILRFARAYEQGGGVEGHLADLNRILGARSRVTTIQLQLTADPNRLEPTDRRLSGSRLLTVPLLAAGSSTQALGTPRTGWLSLSSVKSTVVGWLLPTHRANTLAMRLLASWRAIPARGGEATGAATKTAELLKRFKVDLVVLHACEGRDSAEILDVVTAARVPVAIVHHFSNDRLGAVSARQQVWRAGGIGGASSVAVPKYLRGVLWNLSDAVDTNFYSRTSAQLTRPEQAGPFIFAPGRLTPEKGQVDVLEVVRLLRSRGLRSKVVFAGRADDPGFEAHLRHIAERHHLSDAVTFLGDLSLEQYRDWYCGADLMLMPTRHAEGMPRTLIESQAMQVPPVVYDIGGTREGVRHGETGFVIRLDDVEAMTAAVESLLRDPSMRQSMANAGRRFVESSFNLESLAERHERFYAHVLGHSRRQ